VPIEKPEGLLRRRGRETDQEGVEVLEDLPPKGVDRAVALVDEDDIEVLDGELRAVGDRDGLLDQRLERPERALVHLFLQCRLALQNRVQALDGCDTNPSDRVELV